MLTQFDDSAIVKFLVSCIIPSRSFGIPSPLELFNYRCSGRRQCNVLQASSPASSNGVSHL